MCSSDLQMRPQVQVVIHRQRNPFLAQDLARDEQLADGDVDGDNETEGLVLGEALGESDGENGEVDAADAEAEG